MPETTFGDLLRSRALVFGLTDDKGSASAERLAGFLAARGVRATTRAVESWFHGERAPRIGRMELVLDALGVHGDERLTAYRLAARVEVDSPDDLSVAS